MEGNSNLMFIYIYSTIYISEGYVGKYLKGEITMLEIKDPVCGMKIDGETSIYLHHFEGINYYFCSGECLLKFTGNPHFYISDTRGCCKNEQIPGSKNGLHQGHCQNSQHRNHNHHCCRDSSR